MTLLLLLLLVLLAIIVLMTGNEAEQLQSLGVRCVFDWLHVQTADLRELLLVTAEVWAEVV